jgi:hypothetical protein
MTYAAQLFSQLVAPIFIGILLMEKAAVHRMATSITQLTLYQVSSEEIETATKLLEKPATSSGVSQKFRLSKSLTLKMQRGNSAN